MSFAAIRMLVPISTKHFLPVLGERMRRSDDDRGQQEVRAHAAHDGLALAVTLVSAYVGNNQVPASDIPSLIASVHASIRQIRTGEPVASSVRPAIAIKHSITDSHIVCLEDGKKLKMLKRYLRTHYQLSPEQYRAKWALPRDYPMVAPAYAQLRSNFAKQNGLGLTPSRSTPTRKAK